MRYLLIILLLPLACFAADDIYMTKEAFIAEAFGGVTPEKKSLWTTKAMEPDIHKIMDRNYRLLKTNYWEKDGKTVWILEEIGKYKPITTGIVIEEDAIARVKVLTYRESHGWEVKHDFFTDQFDGRKLKDNLRLDGYIDNISGATMSVDAIRNLGELALYLHQRRNDDE